jgi:uncharacterized protein
MSVGILRDVIEWQNRLNGGHSIEITFHGGEPLVPGIEFYRAALPLLRDGLAARRVRFGLQSNLWLLTDELCALFREYRVSIGTSLDGPESLNDEQRGKGYYRRTMAGIALAREHRLDVGCICTLTRASLPQAQRIFDFFLNEGFNFSIHAAVPSLQHPESERWSLTAQEHGALLVEMLDRYLDNLTHVRISTLDLLCHSVSAGQGGICTFGDCLGGYLAVGPDGTIYPCQRFAGMPAFALAHVQDRPSQADLEQSSVWRMLAKRQEEIAQECGDCAYLSFCRGGCPYNALALGKGTFQVQLRDPHCEGYRCIFAHIADRALQEVFTEDNLAAVIERPDPEKGMLRQGRLLALMRGGTHPYESARHARRLLAAVALADSRTPEEAAHKLEAAGAIRNSERSLPALKALSARLNVPPHGLNNLYLHVTFDCNLRCTHCYASAGARDNGHTAPQDLARACQEAATLGFRHAVITGGEPLVHPQREDLLDALAGLRHRVTPLLTVLRTNLSVPMDADLLRQVARSTDQVVVSLDGDQTTHDARRGAGSYAATLANLRALVVLRKELGEEYTDLSLATVLPLRQANGAPGESVRTLAKELGIRRTRFRPLLPLGRAAEFELEIVPETMWGHLDADEMISYGFTPTLSCGMGQNLYIEPDGQAFPCYAWHSAPWALGNVYSGAGLRPVLEGERFRSLAGHTVNTNRRCQACALRYLCGGACRAWNRLPAEAQTDLDAPPLDCTHLHERARSMMLSAQRYLEIGLEQWQRASLPLPDYPPDTELCRP